MKLEAIVNNLKTLPPAPRVMPMLLRSLNDLDTSTDDIVQLLLLDAGLAAKVLAVSNSAYYGGDGSTTEVGEAVTRVGFREIYRIVTNIYSRAFVGQRVGAYQMDANERWFNSVATGIIMEMLSRRLQMVDPATAYTIGLLHDIGKTAIDELFGSSYEKVLQMIETRGMTQQSAEIEVFGVDHAQVGAALMRSWGFPEAIVEPVGFQFEPGKAANFIKEASMLHLSRWICASIGGAPGACAWAFRFDSVVLETLSCSHELVMELMLASKDELKRKEDLLQADAS
jgi:putative nucleotidyltransferase with HDIG domain